MVSPLFYILYGFRDMRVQRIAKIKPLPKLGGNNGPIVLLRGVLNLTPIATYTVIFIQIGQFFRKISTDNFLRTDRQKDRQAHRHTHTSR